MTALKSVLMNGFLQRKWPVGRVAPAAAAMCSSEYSAVRSRYWELERLWEEAAESVKLSDGDLAVHEAHREAIHRGHFTYSDPESGELVMSRYYHFLKGSCCGQGCRHCTYDMAGVSESVKRSKAFNGSFWADRPWAEGARLKGIQDLRGLVRVKPKGANSLTQDQAQIKKIVISKS